MRWTKAPFKDGDTRIVEVFLWAPKTIKGETRFLEKAKIKQAFSPSVTFLDLDLPISQKWIDIEWVD